MNTENIHYTNTQVTNSYTYKWHSHGHGHNNHKALKETPTGAT